MINYPTFDHPLIVESLQTQSGTFMPSGTVTLFNAWGQLRGAAYFTPLKNTCLQAHL